MTKIKVLNILTDSNIGGAGHCLVNYLKYRDDSRFDVEVILPAGGALIPRVEALGVRVIPVEGIADKSFDRAAVSVLRRAVEAEAPDIVHTHGSLSGRIAGKRAGVRVVYTRHSAFPVPGYLRHGPGHWLSAYLNRRYADAILAVSPAVEENLIDLGAPRDRIVLMDNGVAPLPRSAPADCAALREKFGIPDGVFIAGILARLEPYKGQLLLLDAAKRLKDEGRDFRILIGGSGSQEAELLEKLEALALRDRVLFLGFVEDVPAVMSILDAQLNCSFVEASSLSLLEGMSLGLATVASDCGGNPHLVSHGETGLLFPAGDAAALADRLRRLMDDQALVLRLRENAKKAYETRFTGAQYARRMERVYENLMKRGG